MKQVDESEGGIDHCYSSFDRQQISPGSQKIGKSGGDFVAGDFPFGVRAYATAGRSSVGRIANHGSKTFGTKSFLDIADIGLTDRYSLLKPVHPDISVGAINHT